ncbi:MAG: hypothetical protein ACE5JR_04160 [Gemmatimonadota bacterium]
MNREGGQGLRPGHGKLPYPEGIACAEVQVAGETGGGKANADLPWLLVIGGILTAAVVEHVLRQPSLPFAVGLYLPISLATPLLIVGALRKAIEARADEAGRKAKRERGVRGFPRTLVPTLLLAAACGDAPRSHAGLTDSAYVELLARLVLVEATTPAVGPPLARRQAEDSARAAILEEHGVSPDSLIRFAEIAGRDPARMQALWEAIAARVDSLTPGMPASQGAGEPAPASAEGIPRDVARRPPPGVPSRGNAAAGPSGRPGPVAGGEPPARTTPATVDGEGGEAPARPAGGTATAADTTGPRRLPADSARSDYHLRRLRRQLLPRDSS